MADAPEKATEMLKVFIGERLSRDLDKLARLSDRKTSEYVRLLLLRHVYGHSKSTDGEDLAEE